MIKTGEYFENIGGHLVTTRVNAMEIIDELKRSVEYMNNTIDRLEEENRKIKDEKFQDETIQKLKKENEILKADSYRGFPISEEEDKKIKEWIRKWKDDHHYGIEDMGTIGGGFSYRFIPTSIGTIGIVIAPDGEEFAFREL